MLSVFAFILGLENDVPFEVIEETKEFLMKLWKSKVLIISVGATD